MTEVWKFTVPDSIRFAGGFELIGAFDFNNGFFFKSRVPNWNTRQKRTITFGILQKDINARANMSSSCFFR